MKKIPIMIQRALRDVRMLGSFSPQTFHIFLSTSCPSSFIHLTANDRRVLGHEFGHLLHYLTSYIGLKDLSFWVDSINAIINPTLATTAEETITQQSEQIIRLARSKQILSIDDEYYFEEQDQEYDNARNNQEYWTFREVIGRLFRVNGTLSETHWFWGLRFYVASPDNIKTFIRIPVAMKTILEHMAKAIDFFAETRSEKPDIVSFSFAEQAYEPELLHYYCLSHYAGLMLERKYGNKEIDKAFIIAGQIALLVTIIPFDHTDIWNAIQAYAQTHRADIAPYMKIPHPSFLIPILFKAAELSNFPLNTFSIKGMSDLFEGILKEVGLPSLSELELRTRKYAYSLFSRMETNDIGMNIKNLVEWVFDYAQHLNWDERLNDPMKNINENLPVPVVFNDEYSPSWEGSIFPMETVLTLAKVIKRQNEMLRFPYTRNIVE